MISFLGDSTALGATTFTALTGVALTSASEEEDEELDKLIEAEGDDANESDWGLVLIFFSSVLVSFWRLV